MATINNKAASGTTVGTLVTNLPSPTLSLPQGGGNYVTANGAGVVSTSFQATDRMYQRTVECRGQVVSGAASDQTIRIKNLSVPVVEATSATLTVSRSGGAMSHHAFADWRTAIGAVVTASGGTPPYRFAVITDLSPVTGNPGRQCPIGIDPVSGQQYIEGWLDETLQATESWTVRVEDVTGAWGSLNQTLTVTAFDPFTHVINPTSGLPDLIDFNPTNITGVDAAVTGINVTQNGANHLLLKNTGSITRALNVTGNPDGIDKYSVICNGDFQCGTNTVGTSSTLASQFARAAGRFPDFYVNTIWRRTVAGAIATGVFAFGNDSAGFATKSNMTLNAGPNVSLVSLDDTTSQSLTSGSSNTGPLNQWNSTVSWIDGSTPRADMNYTTTITGALNTTDPARTDRTTAVNAMRIGSRTGIIQLARQFMLARPAEMWEHEALTAYLARGYTLPSAYTPPARLHTSGRVPFWSWDPPATTPEFIVGDVFHPHNPNITTQLESTNNEIGVYVNDLYPGTLAGGSVWAPLPFGIITVSGQKYLELRKTVLTTPQYNDVQTNTHFSIGQVARANYVFRSVGYNTLGSMAQRMGLFMALGRGHSPSTDGWSDHDWWFSTAFPNVIEFDNAEQFSYQGTKGSFTLHPSAGGNVGGVDVHMPFLCDRPHWVATDWIDNRDTTHTFNRYFNGRLMRTDTVAGTSYTGYVCNFNDITSNNAKTAFSPDPHGCLVGPKRTYLDKYADVRQPPLGIKKATISGTVATGNTVTANTDDAWINISPTALTKTYRWWTFDPVNGEVARAAAGVMSLLIDPSWAGYKLFLRVTASNTNGPTHDQRTYVNIP